MQVWIKSFDVAMQVKQNGIELEVRTPNGEEQLGDCYADMTGLTWSEGRKAKAKGVKIWWNDFILICSSEATLNAAIKAAKEAKK